MTTNYYRPKRTIHWEWDVEYVDEHGDIEHDFQDSGSEAIGIAARFNDDPDADGTVARVVLVHSTIDDEDGVIDRSWAYLREDGTLPEFTSSPTLIADDEDYNTEYVNQIRRVPQKFHAEVARVKLHG